MPEQMDSPPDPAASETPVPPPPQGDDVGWRQAHWALVATQMVRNLRPLVIPLVVILLSQGGRTGVPQLIFLAIGGGILLIATVISFVDWTFYHFRLTAREIEVRSGVISKHERSVPYERIQSVDLIETPLDRLFRVVKVRIETAAGGGGEADLEIRALSRDDATDLRHRLIAARQRTSSASRIDASAPESVDQQAPSTVAPESSELIRSLSNRELLIAGATSGRIGPALAIAGAASQFGDNLVPERIWNRIPWDGMVSVAQSAQIIALAAFMIGLFAWILAIVTTVLTYSGFEVRKDQDQIYMQHGLLDRRRLTIPLRRVQAIRLVESMLRQPFGLAELKFDTAGVGGDVASNGVLFPMLKRNEVVAFLERTIPDFVMDLDHPKLESLPRRARSRYIVSAIVGWVVTVTIAVVVVAWGGWISFWWPALAYLATPGFALFGNARFRDAGWAIERDHFMLRWRAVSRVTIVTRLPRLQYRSLVSSPFQRRVRLTTFQTAVASGPGSAGYAVPHLDLEQAEQLVIRTGSRGVRLARQRAQTWPAFNPSAPQGVGHFGTSSAAGDHRSP